MIMFVVMARQSVQLKEIELSAPVHLPSDQLEFGDLSFHLAIGPGLRNSGVHRALIVGDSIRERGNEAPLGFINLRFELHLGLLSDHRVEAANESLGVGQHRNVLFDDRKRDGLGFG